MATKSDPIIDLLTEIRDLQRAQTQLVQDAHDALLHTERLQKRNIILRIIFNLLIIVFTGAAVYFYYHTLVTSFQGVGG
jgi:hypothetical protein